MVEPAEKSKSNAEITKLTLEDFDMKSVLGQGAFGKVVLAQRKGTQEMYAIKIVEKKLLQKTKKAKEAINERNMLSKLKGHPGIVKLYFTFQDETSLYFVVELASGGDLFERLQFYNKKFPLDLTIFYTAEMINVLEYLAQKQIAHRDLKPENVLLDEIGHVKLTDWATAKDFSAQQAEESQEQENARKRGATFVGTADYVSPEVLWDQPASTAVDLWALGCMVFQMIGAKPPFRAQTEFLTFEAIRSGKIQFTEDFSEEAKDFISLLLKLNPQERAGANGDFAILKNHPFLQGIDVDNIFNQTPPITSPTKNQMMQLQKEDSDDEQKVTPAASSVKPQQDNVIHQGLILKRGGGMMGFLFKKRQLILTNEPRLIYVDPDNNNKFKGEINVTPKLKAEYVDSKRFNIIAAKRTFVMKVSIKLQEIYKDAREWVDIINNFIADYFKPKGKQSKMESEF